MAACSPTSSGLPRSAGVWPRSSGTDSLRETQSHSCESDAARTYTTESQTAPAHGRPRPIQRLDRLAAAEDHKIVRVVHDRSLKEFAPSGDPPVFQKTVHVQVCQQGTDDSTLRCATHALLAATDPRCPVSIPLLDRHFQPHLN